MASIVKNCEIRNLKVAVVCSRGMACTVYVGGLASTVHSFYGLGMPDLPAKLVLHNTVRFINFSHSFADFSQTVVNIAVIGYC